MGGQPKVAAQQTHRTFLSGPWRGVKLDHGGNGGTDHDELPNPRPGPAWAALSVANCQWASAPARVHCGCQGWPSLLTAQCSQSVLRESVTGSQISFLLYLADDGT